MAPEPAASATASMWQADVASREAGVELTAVAPGSATARLHVRREHVQGHGACHGGYIFLLADTAFAFACNGYGAVTVAQSADIVFVRPAYEGDVLVAEAVERVRAGRSGVYDVTVRRAGDDEVVAEFRGHSRARVPRPSEES